LHELDLSAKLRCLPRIWQAVSSASSASSARDYLETLSPRTCFSCNLIVSRHAAAKGIKTRTTQDTQDTQDTQLDTSSQPLTKRGYQNARASTLSSQLARAPRAYVNARLLRDRETQTHSPCFLLAHSHREGNTTCWSSRVSLVCSVASVLKKRRGLASPNSSSCSAHVRHTQESRVAAGDGRVADGTTRHVAAHEQHAMSWLNMRARGMPPHVST
jgi:hypothetical protein